ncbi:MAG: hypothetical protein EWV75_08870 [Microcystis wesenbergii Mw_QC_S_20081001_S30D]|uniref:Uncharacterized protein n=1 Tax=Microcystis wesenbergii Mw_QC_S_20081001_S30D TaxID=2486245 RepID=A0A552JP53_9CHRO|nr:MAG: hypothetical protein EWV75_08870 [Microcystis wesenbergii Mw_QC_S_20081001_S30D]TRV01573.1 MAG: hypothetical protein EWV73_08935 [Microcystis wesenbergii Mw_QC_B_20070930_S4D]TRV05123.1 MAG: hypothetical protein EWV74_03610 [Microcystis wesenbergii Mw_QC_S_20081001_S30]TRV11145.1 MAG: hypothetical protein EWV89_15625 [Microcystis wesenbergii Mw_QC_B_20070930_S4]
MAPNFRKEALKTWLFSTLCDNQCLSFAGVLLGRALKTTFLENCPHSFSFHTETRRAMFDRYLLILPWHHNLFEMTILSELGRTICLLLSCCQISTRKTSKNR